ncbi:GNAT family N-acetyltransferase [Litorimonas sp. RW-G-Af-16]|uniref:GNAT family N-acetyltransferase n=1 Tax=Litorimonas sp. RW-G-Af-16 TaxID=3241168 RepID=UPI003AAAECE5
MSIETVIKAVDAMTEADWAAWSCLRDGNPALISPYFHPDYTSTIGALRDDVRVVCRYDNGKAAAFLPIQGDRFARPVGAPMSDYHGIISAGGVTYAELLDGTSIGALHFNSAIDTEAMSATHILSELETAALELPDTAEAWRTTRDSSYSRHMKSTRRRIRKAEEEFGPRRFVHGSRDIDVFQSLIKWKVEKFVETGKYNVLSADWTMGLIRRLWERGPDAPLRNDMHALYFGDRLAAIDLGLTDGNVFHSWIVAYDSEFHSFAPGIQLLEGMIDAAQGLGYSRIDLGAGTDGYKRQYATDGQRVVSGYVPVSEARLTCVKIIRRN